MTQEQVALYIGELRFLRAFNYFSVVCHWGSVPLRAEENLGVWDLGKATLDEIYSFIIEDLKYAVEMY